MIKLTDLLKEDKWKSIDHDKMTNHFRSDVKSERTLKKIKRGDFEYFYTDRYKDDDMFYGAITAFHIPTELYAGDLLIGKWGGESDDKLEGSVQVHPEFQRQKVASTMYDLAEKFIGKRFEPASSNTPSAKKFWKYRKQKAR